MHAWRQLRLADISVCFGVYVCLRMLVYQGGHAYIHTHTHTCAHRIHNTRTHISSTRDEYTLKIQVFSSTASLSNASQPSMSVSIDQSTEEGSVFDLLNQSVPEKATLARIWGDKRPRVVVSALVCGLGEDECVMGTDTHGQLFALVGEVCMYVCIHVCNFMRGVRVSLYALGAIRNTGLCMHTNTKYVCIHKNTYMHTLSFLHRMKATAPHTTIGKLRVRQH
jgi:hypothetical protein